MKIKKNKIAILSIIVILAVLIIFFLFDNILMPLYVQKGKSTKVPDIVGLTIDDAKQKMKEAGLDPKEAEYKNDKRYKVGTVIVQNPSAEFERQICSGCCLQP